jgi:hypothetical protein
MKINLFAFCFLLLSCTSLSAQIKIEKVWDTEVSFVEEIISANRGAAGIGSSGH